MKDKIQDLCEHDRQEREKLIESISETLNDIESIGLLRYLSDFVKSAAVQWE